MLDDKWRYTSAVVFSEHHKQNNKPKKKIQLLTSLANEVSKSLFVRDVFSHISKVFMMKRYFRPEIYRMEKEERRCVHNA